MSASSSLQARNAKLKYTSQIFVKITIDAQIKRQVKNRVSDPDPQDPHVFPCPDSDPHKFSDPDPDPGKKVRKWMNKSLFCRVGDVQCKQFHFFCSDFKHPLLRIIWNVKKTQKKIHFSLYPQPPPPDTPRIRIRMKIFARIRIRKKMRIRNTVIFYYFHISIFKV